MLELSDTCCGDRPGFRPKIRSGLLAGDANEANLLLLSVACENLQMTGEELDDLVRRADESHGLAGERDLAVAVDRGRNVDRSLTQRAEGRCDWRSNGGGANLDTGFASGACTGSTDIELSQSIPALPIGNTSGIGA